MKPQHAAYLKNVEILEITPSFKLPELPGGTFDTHTYSLFFTPKMHDWSLERNAAFNNYKI